MIMADPVLVIYCHETYNLDIILSKTMGSILQLT